MFQLKVSCNTDVRHTWMLFPLSQTEVYNQGTIPVMLMQSAVRYLLQGELAHPHLRQSVLLWGLCVHRSMRVTQNACPPIPKSPDFQALVLGRHQIGIALVAHHSFQRESTPPYANTSLSLGIMVAARREGSYDSSRGVLPRRWVLPTTSHSDPTSTPSLYIPSYPHHWER